MIKYGQVDAGWYKVDRKKEQLPVGGKPDGGPGISAPGVYAHAYKGHRASMQPGLLPVYGSESLMPSCKLQDCVHGNSRN
jgi:hypothetical protein